MAGFGYWSGRDVNVEFRPAQPHTGIVFVRRDFDPPRRIAADVHKRIEVPRRTTLVADGTQVEMVEHVLGEFPHLDIVVANSGVASRVQPLWEIEPEHWHKVIGVDLHGAFYTCRATAKHLVDRGMGTIILISSVGADMCAAFGAPYYVAKAGVNALTKCLAKECAPANVRVNCIAPGVVHTDMGERLIDFYGEAMLNTIPLGRAGRPEEIGRAAVYLASDDAAFITGKILRIDGGAWM